MTPKKIGITIIAVLCLVVLFQNTEMITLRFLFWEFAMSQIFLIPIVLALGFILGYSVSRLKGDRGGSA